MDRLEKARRAKLDRLRELGVDPFGQRVWNPLWAKKDDQGRFICNLSIRSGWDKIADAGNDKRNFSRRMFSSDKSKVGKWAFVCGRIKSKNNKGKLKFFFIEDETGKIQTMFSRSEFTEDEWEIIKCLEVNDIISVGGFVMTTEAGEQTIFVGGYEPITAWDKNSPLSERIGGVEVLCKSLAHPPEKFHGISDEETLVRKRHLGISTNKTLRDNLIKRSHLVAEIRSFLNKKDFLEFETPILSSQASGATAEPFHTHHNAMDMPLQLRIAPELYLKKLLVGGIPKVYEIGKVFRNEGIDRTHNPEFTILELYQAYGDLDDMMRLTKELICYLMPEAKDLPRNEKQWNVKTFQDACAEVALEMCGHGIDVLANNGNEMARVVTFAKLRIDDDLGYKGDDYWEAVDYIFDKRVQPKLQDGWTFITDYPTALCPLAKPINSYNKISGRFELFTKGMEIANAYTELNDPDIQLEMFEKQGTVDEDFIDALKLGMPPAGGLGIGIDRLVMLATKSHSIRDVISFPLVKDSD